jgi:hypothetical protein
MREDSRDKGIFSFGDDLRLGAQATNHGSRFILPVGIDILQERHFPSGGFPAFHQQFTASDPTDFADQKALAGSRWSKYANAQPPLRSPVSSIGRTAQITNSRSGKSGWLVLTCPLFGSDKDLGHLPNIRLKIDIRLFHRYWFALWAHV